MSGVFLFDRKQNLLKAVDSDDIIENYQEIEINNLIKATLVLKYKKEFEEAYYFGVKEENDFWLYSIRNYIKEDNKLSLQGIHIMFDELKGVLVKDLRPKNKMAGPALNAALAGSTWTAISSATNTASTSLYYISALDSLYKICKEWNVEFKPVLKFVDGKIKAKEIHLTYNQGSDYGKVFSYGDNLVSVVAETSKDELFTAFVGRGKGEEITDDKGNPTGGYGRKITFEDIDYKDEKDGIKVHSPKGIDYIEIEEATALYGYPDGRPRITSVDFDDIEDKEKLARATFEYAIKNCRPKVQLKATGYQKEPVALGEVVTIIADMGIRYKTRVFKIKKDFISQKIVSFEFGDKVAFSLSSRLKAADLEKKDEEVKQLSYIESILQAIESSYFNDDGYQYDLKVDNKYKLPAGFYSFNKPIDKNPSKVIYLGAGKLMIANGKKPNGQWDFRVALDGDSVNASVIRAGILEGGKVFWNLEDGTFLIGNSKEDYKMYWDGQTLHFRNVNIDLSNNYQISEINQKIEDNTNTFNNSVKDLDDKLVGLNNDVGRKLSNITGEIETVRQDFKVGQGQFESTINTKIKNLSADVEVNFEDVNKRISGNVTGIANLNSQIKQTESSITQSVANQIKAVNDKISTESSGIKSYVQENYSTKTQTADMIESKVSSINSRLGSAESRISQTNSKIESEIRGVMNNAASDYFNLSTKITQTKNAIESKVSSGDVRSIFRQEANSFTFDAKQVNFNSNVKVKGTFETNGTNLYNGSYEPTRTVLDDGAIKFYGENNSLKGGIFAYETLRIASPSIAISASSMYSTGKTNIFLNKDSIDLWGETNVMGDFYTNGSMRCVSRIQVGEIKIEPSNDYVLHFRFPNGKVFYINSLMEMTGFYNS